MQGVNHIYPSLTPCYVISYNNGNNQISYALLQQSNTIGTNYIFNAGDFVEVLPHQAPAPHTGRVGRVRTVQDKRANQNNAPEWSIQIDLIVPLTNGDRSIYILQKYLRKMNAIGKHEPLFFHKTNSATTTGRLSIFVTNLLLSDFVLPQQINQPLQPLPPHDIGAQVIQSGGAQQIEQVSGNFAQMKLSEDVKIDNRPSIAVDQSITVDAGVIIDTACETTLKLADQVSIVLERFLKSKHVANSMSWGTIGHLLNPNYAFYNGTPSIDAPTIWCEGKMVSPPLNNSRCILYYDSIFPRSSQNEQHALIYFQEYTLHPLGLADVHSDLVEKQNFDHFPLTQTQLDLIGTKHADRLRALDNEQLKASKLTTSLQAITTFQQSNRGYFSQSYNGGDSSTLIMKPEDYVLQYVSSTTNPTIDHSADNYLNLVSQDALRLFQVQGFISIGEVQNQQKRFNIKPILTNIFAAVAINIAGVRVFIKVRQVTKQ